MVPLRAAFDLRKLKTIETMLNPATKPKDLSRPGHLFPLRVHPRGLHERRGHTEASVALLQMAGLTPLAVIAEVMNDDGTMARLPDLETMAKDYYLTIVSIMDIVEGIE